MILYFFLLLMTSFQMETLPTEPSPSRQSEYQTSMVRSDAYAPSWEVNDATNALFKALVEAAREKKPYFSAQQFYNYYTKNILYKETDGRFLPLSPAETDLDKVIRYRVDKHPLVYGLDLAHCEERGWYQGQDALKRRATAISIVRKAWQQYGAVPILSWHLENPYVPHAYYSVNKNSVGAIYNKAKGTLHLPDGRTIPYPSKHANVPREILNGAAFDDGVRIVDHEGYWLPSNSSTKCGRGTLEGDDNPGYDSPREWFDASLEALCTLINEFTDENGDGIPLILRLFHEPETRFAWWGYGVSKNDYKELMRYAVSRIRSLCPHKNVLFAYCKDRYWGTETYGDRYPGDDYIDLVGYDDYSICSSDDSDKSVITRMRILTDFARMHHKVPALFETGNKSEYAKKHAFLNERLYGIVMSEGVNLGIVQLWSTFTTSGDSAILRDYQDFLNRPDIRTFSGTRPFSTPQ